MATVGTVVVRGVNRGKVVVKLLKSALTVGTNPVLDSWLVRWSVGDWTVENLALGEWKQVDSPVRPVSRYPTPKYSPKPRKPRVKYSSSKPGKS